MQMHDDEKLLMVKPVKDNPFKLDDEFISLYENKNPKYGMDILGLVTYYRTYSRPIPELGRNEHWYETVRRVVEGVMELQRLYCMNHTRKWSDIKAQRIGQVMYDKIFNFKVSPPGRGLWMQGTQFVKERGSAALNNCCYISTEHINDPEYGAYPWAWMMDFLMLGAGVSSDTRGKNKVTVKKPIGDVETYIIPDSREGWVNSVWLLIESYFKGTHPWNFDYSKLRSKGVPIKGFGGIASGPGPLIEMHENIREILDSRIDNVLTSVNIVDMFNNIAKCVVAGNVRRSATLLLGDADDKEFMTMKDPILHQKELWHHRWASNNSVNASVGKIKYEDFAESICRNGEPGFIWMDVIRTHGRMMDPPDTIDANVGATNPCSEIPLESGEMCNLVTVYPSHHDTYDEFEESLKYAYVYTKSVTLLDTGWPLTNEVMHKNRRIGISVSGIIDAFEKHGREKVLDWFTRGFEYVKKLDADYSKNWLFIPNSCRIGTVKPEGTVSILAGVSPGIHYPHDKYYIRRIRIAANSNLCEILENHGYHYELERDTKVFEFPIMTENFKDSKQTCTVEDQFKNAADLQRVWADNSVSITITFKHKVKRNEYGEPIDEDGNVINAENPKNPIVLESDIDEVIRCLYKYEGQLKCVSLLPDDPFAYPLMPYESITKEKFEEMWKPITPIDFHEINLFQAPENEEKYCNSDGCEYKQELENIKEAQQEKKQHDADTIELS
jgi:hypothetical protein